MYLLNFQGGKASQERNQHEASNIVLAVCLNRLPFGLVMEVCFSGNVG
jgi:hypothetical protein